MNTGAGSRALFTDLYELTMSQAFWQSGATAEATFSLLIRSYPADRAYFVLAGIEDSLDFLEGLQFTQDDRDYLGSLDKFDKGFLAYLGDLRFSGSVRAMAEGGIFFAGEPVLEITAPIIEAQIVETALINHVNLQTILATKASRVIHAANGRYLVDFAARRAHGFDAANRFARASYIVGFAGTSNTLAGSLYGIPTFGTMAHSFVESFGSEQQAFNAYASSFPDSTTLLVDTYDTVEGVGKAIDAARELRMAGHALRAVRLDSGDLLDLSWQARALLDDAGLKDVQVFASGGLDEYGIDELLTAGAPIDGFGVGTMVGSSADAPWTDCAYKLVEYAGRPTMKLSASKLSLPGRKQVFRIRDGNGAFRRDLIARAEERSPAPPAESLLETVMSGGERSGKPEALKTVRGRFREQFAGLPDRHKALRSPPAYPVGTSDELERLATETRAQIEGVSGVKTEGRLHT